MQSSPTTKFRKLAPSESLAMLVDTPTSDEEACGVQGEPIAVRVAVQRLRLVLVTTVMVAAIVALTLVLNQGVVVERFDRRDVSIKQQEAMLEKYNSYSGSVAGALERPVELALGFAVQVVVLRTLTDDVLRAQNRWRVTATGVAIGATATYLLTNGLSAVNVQVREQTVQMVIQAEDLAIPEPNTTGTTTANASFSEHQHANPVANTIMRSLVLQPPTAKSPDSCPETDGVDRVEYRIPQRPWMKDFIPTALETKSMRLEITKTKSALNDALTIDQFPMNASVAAELLAYSFYDRQNGSAWAWAYGSIGLSDFGFLNDTAIESVDQNPAIVWRKNGKSLETHVPIVRLSNFLPANPASTEQEDRAWFLKHSAAAMYNVSNPKYKNASQLKSWNMTFAHVDIEPNVLWLDAVTIERELVSPRLQTENNRSYGVNNDKFKDFKFIPKADNVPDDRIDMYMGCADAAGLDALVAVVTKNSTYVSAKCLNRSSHSLVVISRGHRLVADTIRSYNGTRRTTKSNSTAGNYSIEIDLFNETWSNTSVMFSDFDLGNETTVISSIVNLREVVSVTVARLSWNLQNLSAMYKAKCAADSGCLGLDVALGSGQRLVVSERALPLNALHSLLDMPTTGTLGTAVVSPPPFVSVRRPVSDELSAFKIGRIGEYIGDVLMPHNIRNKTPSALPLEYRASMCVRYRLATVLNNHVYMESTLQPAYTAAAMFLLQSGVVRDVLNQSTTNRRVLDFNGNTQDVQVYVYIPQLNVIVSLVGCVLLVVVISLVVLWPHGPSDPLLRVTDPHAIANVLFNERAFPPLLLSRFIVPSDDLDDFQIQSLALHRTTDQESPPPCTATDSVSTPTVN